MGRAVVTGVGIVSVLGVTRESVTDSLYHGVSGIDAEPDRIAHGMRSALTGIVRGFDEGRFLNRKQRKTMPLCAVQAHAAVMDALDQANLPQEALRNDRCGLIFGNDSAIVPTLEQANALAETGQTASMGSGHVFRSMNSAITLNLNALLGNTGPGWTVSAACASGACAVGMAADAIRLGRQDVMICGAAQELGWQAVAAFDGIGAFSVRTPPQEASRPFDADRDGLVPSGGAAALILEDIDHARRRGAAILGEILGFGMSADGQNLAVPGDTGLSRAMAAAIADAGLAPEEIDCISAHATSTPLGDAAEQRNILRIFPDACPPVLALKSLTGHELWMSGASQVVYAILMARSGFTAATANHHRPDPDMPPLPILTCRRDVPPGRILCNAAGFGGSNACLVVDCR
ncbi:MAG: beta-ketoacyl-[acyl-carrier-protein] synthase family protein [Desulfovibrio sp.]|nr:beta-ketoacyl-[acyl-carrier-protein] synthase family protein [Desulfovibrio sp.]